MSHITAPRSQVTLQSSHFSEDYLYNDTSVPLSTLHPHDLTLGLIAPVSNQDISCPYHLMDKQTVSDQIYRPGKVFDPGGITMRGRVPFTGCGG